MGGIYFEKNKKQKKRKINKLILSNDFHKLRSFTRISIGLLKNPDLTFLSLIQEESTIYQKALRKENFNPNLQIFEIYRILFKTVNFKLQKQKILNFCRWLTFKNLFLTTNKDLILPNSINFIKYFNLIFKFLKKYQVLQLLLLDKIGFNIENKKSQKVLSFSNKPKRLDLILNSSEILKLYQLEFSSKSFLISTQRIK